MQKTNIEVPKENTDDIEMRVVNEASDTPSKAENILQQESPVKLLGSVNYCTPNFALRKSDKIKESKNDEIMSN